MQERICHMEAGRIKNRDTIAKLFKSLGDGTYLLRIFIRRKRSLPQNDYYWGVICEMVKEGLRDAGYENVRTPEDAHEVLKYLFLKQQVYNKNTGELLAEIPGSTAVLNTYDFSQYIERIIQWAAEYLSIVIPYPNEEPITNKYHE